jgi:hypothetical protein
MRFATLLTVLLLACAPLVAAAPPTYSVDYRVAFHPAAGEASVVIRITPDDGRAQRLRFSIDPERHSDFEGDGRISTEGDRVTWRPGRGAAELRYRYAVDRPREDGSFVARMTPDWALLRIDRLIPPVAVIAPDGAESTATLEFRLPKGWTQAEVGYPRVPGTQRFRIETPGRRFQRPLGWMIAGDIGTRTEQLGDMKVAVAAPKGSALRRNDVLAFINATAMELESLFGRLPPKLLIVGADDSMWRGGLSGPGSLYLHPDRPLISENGSSTLMHEVVHVVSGIRGAAGDDWIAEGLAEYYGIELLRRGGLLSEERADKAVAWMRNHGRKVTTLQRNRSAGPRTARAVALLADLDAELRKRSGGKRSLDDVVRPLVGSGRISRDEFRAAAERVLGGPSVTLKTPLLPP